MWNNKGGITVFLAVTFMAVLTFAGSLIDIARIQAAERKVESALSTSVRSVLADYDGTLCGEFGIFGLDTRGGPEVLKQRLMRYFQLNLTERHQGIRFIRYDLQGCRMEAEGLGSLTDESILRQQILQYMKYKAPAVMVENAADSFDGDVIAGFKKAKLGQKMAFAEKEKAVRGKALALEEKLEALNGRIRSIRKNAESLTERKLQVLMEGLEDAIADKLPQCIEAHAAYAAARQQSVDFLQEKDPADNLRNGEAGMQANESIRYDQVEAGGEKAGAAIQKYMRIAAPTAEEVSSLRDRIDRQQSELGGLLARQEQTGEDAEQIDSLRQQIEQLEQEIDDRLEALDRTLADIRLEEVEAGEDVKTNGKAHSEKQQEQKQGYENKTEEVRTKLEALGRYIPAAWLLTARELADVRDESDGDMEKLMQSAISVHDRSGAAQSEKSYDNAISYMRQLLQFLEDTSLNMRDKLYLTEYVMDRFTFITSKTERTRHFKKGEVEYILSGSDIPYDMPKNSQAAVVKEVMAQVWFLRFAIDAIDSFAANGIPDPFARLAWALAEGSIQACSDMLAMLAGEAVSISPGCPGIRLQYSDHLRFLLLMQDEEVTLRRIQQLMQVNIKMGADVGPEGSREDFKLGRYQTAVRASVSVPVNLWFLPVLSLDKLGFEGFQGNRYVVEKEVYIGY